MFHLQRMILFLRYLQQDFEVMDIGPSPNFHDGAVTNL